MGNVQYSGSQNVYIFTKEEHTDMHFIYSFCNENGMAAVMEYQQQ
jgi:hypothetical protein